MPKKSFIILAIVILIVALILGYSFLNPRRFESFPSEERPEDKDGMEPEEAAPPEDENPPQGEQKQGQNVVLSAPIGDAMQRVTKKPFGVFVTPDNSPVEPERFSGFHTGVDFEILPGEEEQEVAVMALCDGEIVYKDAVNGYGGLLIQSCQIDGRDVTVLYGHLNLSSITKQLGEKLGKGERIGILGAPFSPETDGERKHLHLGIHKGSEIELRGYVPDERQLAEWLDVRGYIA